MNQLLLVVVVVVSVVRVHYQYQCPPSLQNLFRKQGPTLG